MAASPADESVDLSIVVPTLNEALNLAALTERIDAALGGRRYEILFVDDASTDDTVAVCERLARKYPVRLHVRTHPKDGLSGAVLDGFELARGHTLVVMDADLQHPPERLPVLLETLESGEADFVLGSRHVAGASTDERWSLARRINSRVATLLARPFAGNVRDPMSGFFAMRRNSLVGAGKLSPLGYKIALELMCKCRMNAVREVPIHFATRAKGESKLTVKQQFKYLEHLSRLYDFTYPRISPIGKFIFVTAIAWLVGMGLFLTVLIPVMSLGFSASIAYLGAIAITSIFHARYVRTQREFIFRKHPWIDFIFTAMAEWAACSLTAGWLAERFDQPTPIEIFFASFTVATLVRYVMRKEFFQDIRGLRKEIRFTELT